MTATRESKKHARRLFDACLVGDVVDAGRVRDALALLVQRRPPGCLSILAQFHRLVRLNREASRVIVETAVPLTPEFRTRVISYLGKLAVNAPTVDFVVSGELIAGARIKVGSDVYDSTIKNRLERLLVSLS